MERGGFKSARDKKRWVFELGPKSVIVINILYSLDHQADVQELDVLLSSLSLCGLLLLQSKNHSLVPCPNLVTLRVYCYCTERSRSFLLVILSFPRIRNA